MDEKTLMPAVRIRNYTQLDKEAAVYQTRAIDIVDVLEGLIQDFGGQTAVKVPFGYGFYILWANFQYVRQEEGKQYYQFTGISI